jgi:hypothetical protein
VADKITSFKWISYLENSCINLSLYLRATKTSTHALSSN